MYISEDRFKQEMAQIERENQSKERAQKLKEARQYKPNKPKLTTTKLIVSYLFVVLNVVLAYALIAMWHFADLSYLGVLITDVAAQVITLAIYAVKAGMENRAGGITYETAMAKLNLPQEMPKEEIIDDFSPIGSNG